MGNEAAAIERAASLRTTTLRITEIFLSLQGETSRAGLPTVFVRLTRCLHKIPWGNERGR